MAIADAVDGMGPTAKRTIVISNAPFRACLAIAASVFSFAALVERAGYVPAVFATVLIASCASRELPLRRALLLAALVAAALAVLFVGLLDQALSLFPMF